MSSDLDPQSPTRSKRPVGYIAPDALHQPLYVVTALFNPLRWKSRWKLYERFAKHVADSGAVLYTVEIALGERDHAASYAARHEWRAKCDFEVDMIREHQWIRLVSDTWEEWVKEPAIKRGVAALPLDWKKVAWVDADCLFLRPNWVGECLHLLERYKFLQMFSTAMDLGPGYEVIGSRPSFLSAYLKKEMPPLRDTPLPYPYPYQQVGKKVGFGAWSGLAWAARRDAWDAVGGLPDFCITGAADWYVAWGLIGRMKEVIPANSHPRFAEALMHWEWLAERFIRRDVGIMAGTVAHYFHGRKRDRRYVERSDLLSKLAFDPTADLKRDWQGLPVLIDDGSERALQLREGIREWLQSRNEDVNEA